MSKTPGRDEPQCVIAFVSSTTSVDKVRTFALPESCAWVAKKQGWLVVGRDSDVLTSIDPAQSNPRRQEDDGA